MGWLELKVPPPFVAIVICGFMWLANHLMGAGLAFGAALLSPFGTVIAWLNHCAIVDLKPASR